MLKPLKATLLAMLVLTLTACAIQTREMTAVSGPKVTKPAPGKALVVFMRPSLFGGTIQATLYDGKKYIGTISSQTQIAYQARPGKHLFMVVAENADFLRATLRRGKTYYVIVTPRPGFIKTRFI